MQWDRIFILIWFVLMWHSFKDIIEEKIGKDNAAIFPALFWLYIILLAWGVL